MKTIIITEEQEVEFSEKYNIVKTQREYEYDLLKLAERVGDKPPPMMDFYKENHFNLPEDEFELFKQYLLLKDAEESNSFKEFMKTIGVPVPEPVLN